MRKLIISAVGGVLLIIVSIYLAGRIAGSKKTPRPTSQKSVKTVFVDTVTNGTVPIIVPANGNLKASKRVELYAEVQGVFKPGSKRFRTGQAYKAGQPLIRIDAAEYYASVQASKSNFYTLLTSILPDLRLDYPDSYPTWQHYVNGFDLNAPTPALPDLSSAQEKFFVSGRGVLSDYYTLKNLEERLTKYTIVAPFDGVLAEALVTEGTLVRAGQKLGEYISTGLYELEVAVGKAYADVLSVGRQVRLANLNNTQTYMGVINRINGRVDQNSQTITVFIEVRDATLKEGQYLEAKLQAKAETDAVAVDRSLLLENNQIFVVKEGMLELLPVTPVYFTDTEAVLKNVPEGTVMVARPIPGAYTGMLVHIAE